MSIEPEQARTAIAEAELRTNQRQVRQMRLLIVALIALTLIAATSAAGFFIAYGQAHTNGETAKKILTLTQNVADLQDRIITATVIAQLGTNRILDCTTPEGKCAQEGNQHTAAAIAALNAASAAGRKDVLQKVGQLVRLLGVPQASIDRILAQPEATPPPFVSQMPQQSHP